MKQHELIAPPGANRSRKRVGRGYGSGHGKTAGKGQKGQNARTGGGVRAGFEGGQNPLTLRMPYKRGFKNPFTIHYEILNLADLQESLRTNVDVPAELTPEWLLKMGLIDHKTSSKEPLRVKLLGDGEINRPITVRVHKVSAGARAKIEAAGGRIEELA